MKKAEPLVGRDALVHLATSRKRVRRFERSTGNVIVGHLSKVHRFAASLLSEFLRPKMIDGVPRQHWQGDLESCEDGNLPGREASRAAAASAVSAQAPMVRSVACFNMIPNDRIVYSSACIGA